MLTGLDIFHTKNNRSTVTESFTSSWKVRSPGYPATSTLLIKNFVSDDGEEDDAPGEKEVGGQDVSDSMVGSYICKFNTWGAQTDDCKLDNKEATMDDVIDTEKCQQNGMMPEESLGLYQRSVVKMKTFGSEMMSSYKEPLDNAVISGTELQ